MAIAKPQPDAPKTIAEALAELHVATRVRHAALIDTPEYRLAESEESRLVKLIWRIAGD